MITTSEKHNCNGCHACASVCPKQCIVMKADTEGFKYPQVNEDLCVNCGLCDSVCPILNRVPENNRPIAYAAINFDDTIREKSSSGGIFFLLAEYVIANGGVVFGARFDDDFNVVHDYAQTMEEVKYFMGSKYTQSTIGENYLYAKKFLDTGRLVLFTGTPCQIGGLKAFLNKEYDNLICQDLICHGVPSPKAWKEYIRFRESMAKANIQKVFFRDKTRGWKTYSMALEFSAGKREEEMHKTDMFMRAFLQNLCLRPSCYHCVFKSKSREADITLADFWGVQNIMPDMDDDSGTSLVIIHDSKGAQLFESIKPNLKYNPVELEQAIKYNPSMIRSAAKRPEREKFLSEIQKRRFDKVVNKYCNPKIKFLTRIKIKIKKIFHNNK